MFSSSNSNTRTIAFGTGNISCSGTGTVWNISTSTSLTTTGTQVVNITSVGATAITVNPGTLSEANSISYNFTGGTYALTFSGIFFSSQTVKNVDFTGYAGTWQAIGFNSNIYGNLTLSTGMSLTASSNSLIFAATSDTKTITSNGKMMDFPITFDGVGGTWQLQDAMTLGSTRTATLTNGTLDLFGKTFTVGTRFTTATGTKNITFNGGTLVCPDANTTSFNNASPTGFTTTAGTGTGIISMTAATAKTFSGNGSTYNCTLNQGGAGTLTITGANTFNDITETVPTANQITFPASTTTTVNNFTLSGTAGNLVSIRSSTPGTRFTLSKSSGAVSVSYVDIQDSNATGGATWQATTTNGNVDSGNNLGWSFISGTYVDASAAVIALADVSAIASRVRLFQGSVNASATVTAVATRLLMGQGSINCDATVTATGIRVRVGSGSVTGSAVVTAAPNFTASGNAAIAANAAVSAYANATFDSAPIITGNATISADGQIIGEEWGDSSVVTSTWDDISPSADTWQPASQSSNTWLRQ